MDSTKLKEMLIAEKNEQQEYIDIFYKRMYELEEMIWKIERLEKEEQEKSLEWQKNYVDCLTGNGKIA